MTTPRSSITVTRRRALAGVTGVGLAMPVLSACGDDGSTSGTATGNPASETASETASEASSEATSEAPAVAAGVVSTADVPVGSGVILSNEQVVVTQPTAGDLKVFSSICTHSGCPVSDIQDDVIMCRCHGSTFDAATGDVLGGPAPAPLPAVGFTVRGDQVVLS